MDPRQQMDSGRASVGDEGSVMNGRYAGHQQEHALAQLSPWPTVAGGAVQGFRRANDANEILQNDLENGDLRYWALHGLYDSAVADLRHAEVTGTLCGVPPEIMARMFPRLAPAVRTVQERPDAVPQHNAPAVPAPAVAPATRNAEAPRRGGRWAPEQVLRQQNEVTRRYHAHVAAYPDPATRPAFVITDAEWHEMRQNQNRPPSPTRPAPPAAPVAPPGPPPPPRSSQLANRWTQPEHEELQAELARRHNAYLRTYAADPYRPRFRLSKAEWDEIAAHLNGLFAGLPKRSPRTASALYHRASRNLTMSAMLGKNLQTSVTGYCK